MADPAYGARAAVVIEDDDDIRGLLVATLSQAGFTVSSAGSGAEGVELVRSESPAVTTLDVSLPDIDGFEVARRIRLFSDTYIVMLTARAEEIDTLMGLDAGADDYLTKPFRPRELRARIEAMLRRPRNLAAPGPPMPGDTADAEPAPADASATATPEHAGGPTAVAGTPAEPGPGTPPGIRKHNGLVVDVPGRLVDVDGERVNLTRSEFDLLAALIENPHRVLAKAELARRLWGEDYNSGTPVTDADKRTVEVHVANLRRKLGEDATQPRYIETVRGIGYRLTPSR
ncbi:response regulator transcription factor [Georgenia sp. MJ206]|uniref:response regulator transcription factor n=1 Tax=Georgenia wangjunii TaxID=3117730 RepID=UPI002F26BB62